MKFLEVFPDPNGHNIFALPAPDYVDVRVLAGGSPESHTVPNGARFVIFSADNDFYCRPNGTASVPSLDIVDGSGSFLNPTILSVEGVSTLGLISPNACNVTMAFYR